MELVAKGWQANQPEIPSHSSCHLRLCEHEAMIYSIEPMFLYETPLAPVAGLVTRPSRIKPRTPELF